MNQFTDEQADLIAGADACDESLGLARALVGMDMEPEAFVRLYAAVKAAVELIEGGQSTIEVGPAEGNHSATVWLPRDMNIDTATHVLLDGMLPLIGADLRLALAGWINSGDVARVLRRAMEDERQLAATANTDVV